MNLADSIGQVLLDTRKEVTSENLILIPVITKEQVEELAILAADIWQEHYSSILAMEQIDYMVDKFQSVSAIVNQIDNQEYQYYVMSMKNTIIGYCAIIEEAEKKSLFLSKIYIHKRYRGNGYANLAFEFLVKLCKEKEYRKIWLTVNRFNETSIQVYEKKGFIKSRTQVADIGNGFVMDDYIMTKTIDGYK